MRESRSEEQVRGCLRITNISNISFLTLFALRRPSERRGSVAEEGEDKGDEEGGPGDLDVTVWVDPKTRLHTPYTVRQVLDAQGVILDMCVWLRSRRVISEVRRGEGRTAEERKTRVGARSEATT